MDKQNILDEEKIIEEKYKKKEKRKSGKMKVDGASVKKLQKIIHPNFKS